MVSLPLDAIEFSKDEKHDLASATYKRLSAKVRDD